MIEPNRAIRIKYGLWDNRERGYPATHSIVDDWVMEDRVNRIEASRGWSRVGTAPVASTWNLPHLPTIKTLCIVSDDQQSRMRTCLCSSSFLTWNFDQLNNEAMESLIEVFYIIVREQPTRGCRDDIVEKPLWADQQSSHRQLPCQPTARCDACRLMYGYKGHSEHNQTISV